MVRPGRTAIARYPTVKEGLRALVECPTNLTSAQVWKGGYVKGKGEAMLSDAWGNGFLYRQVIGTNGEAIVELQSLGPDGVASSDDLVVSVK